MLDIKVENQTNGQVRVFLKGRLDTQTYAQCEERLEPLLAAAPRVLVFDLAELDYLSSMGLRVLMKTNKTITAHGGKFFITRLQPQIRVVIDIANALPPENIFASVEEADRYLELMQQRAMEKSQPGS